MTRVCVLTTNLVTTCTANNPNSIPGMLFLFYLVFIKAYYRCQLGATPHAMSLAGDSAEGPAALYGVVLPRTDRLLERLCINRRTNEMKYN